MAVDIGEARRNAVLDGLNDDELAELLPGFDAVSLTIGDVIYQANRPVDAVYFPTDGVVSIVAELGDGANVEAATVGREGMAGLPVFLGSTTPTERATVQVAGHALRMSAEHFQREMAVLNGPLTARLRRYTQSMFTQLARNAACNRVHSVRERAARWLLTTADRMDGPSFDLTQEFLAQMLAVRRQSVSEVAQALSEDGSITYIRGAITVLDRDKLHRNACDCYDVVRAAQRDALTAR